VNKIKHLSRQRGFFQAELPAPTGDPAALEEKSG
jgi:hypothetical protein